MRLADLKGRSVAVWGTGPDGRAALRAIPSASPSRLIAVDDGPHYCDVDWTGEPAPLAGGDHAFPALVTAEVVVRSSSVPPSHPWLAQLRTRGVAVTTGNALWMTDHAAQTIAVTAGSPAAALLAHLLPALGRVVAVGGADHPLLALPAAPEYVVELSPAECADLTRSPRVAVLTSALGGLELIEHGPDLIVVDGTDVALRDAIRGRTDVNGFPPVPVAAEDSRFRIEAGQLYCSDEPLFTRDALPSPAEEDGRALCLALAVLDGLGIDVPGARDEIRTALASVKPS